MLTAVLLVISVILQPENAAKPLQRYLRRSIFIASFTSASVALATFAARWLPSCTISSMREGWLVSAARASHMGAMRSTILSATSFLQSMQPIAAVRQSWLICACTSCGE